MSIFISTSISSSEHLCSFSLNFLSLLYQSFDSVLFLCSHSLETRPFLPLPHPLPYFTINTPLSNAHQHTSLHTHSLFSQTFSTPSINTQHPYLSTLLSQLLLSSLTIYPPGIPLSAYNFVSFKPKNDETFLHLLLLNLELTHHLPSWYSLICLQHCFV